MARNTKPAKISDELQKFFGEYHETVTQKINACSQQAVKDLVKKTKATAPVASGSFKRNISSKLLKKSPNGDTYVWYVKPPDHRITHLVVHGHATRNGGRTKANPFLSNAMAEVMPDYEKAVKEVIEE